MNFGLLGTLEVRDGDRALTLGGAKQRAALATLLLHANEVVSADYLIEALWGDEPPSMARNTVQAYVSRLRRELGHDRILTRAPGYAMEVDEAELDLFRFRTLAERGRAALTSGDVARAASELRAALALWRGQALPEFTFEAFADVEIARLEEERLSVLEDRIEADLALGRHNDLVGELDALIDEHPLRERLRAHLILALYRAGRQAEALESYRDSRELLVEQLGIEPSPRLQRLHSAILTQDPSLELPAELSPAAGTGRSVPQQPVRKSVTVLVAGISVVSEFDPEVTARVHAEATAAVADVVTKHGGSVDVRACEGVVGLFGVPTLHEDDPVRAVRAALGAHQALARNEHVDLEIGIDTGAVIASAADVIEGAAVTSAGRLGKTAAPGDTLIGDATRRLLGAAVDVEELDRGGPWRIAAFHPDRQPIASRFDVPMVGRAIELAQLRQSFEAALEKRRCHVFTVVGAPGIGKSRLARELISVLEHQATALVGRCLPYGEGITLWPLLEIAKQAAADTSRHGLSRLLAGEERGDLIADRVAALLGDQDAVGASEEIFWSLRKFLEALSRRRPLVVVLEDIHWAEEALLNLVEQLSDLGRDAPILVLCLARPELFDTRSNWNGGRVNASTILLEPLTEADSGLLMDALLTESSLADAQRVHIARVAEGNPLFIEQMLALAQDSDSPAEHGVPATIQVLLAARLDALSSEERILLRTAAVIGSEFWRDALRDLTPELNHLEVDRALQVLITKDLIIPRRSILHAHDAFEFRHILIRDTAYEFTPKQSRALLHERIAEWLAKAASDRIAEFDDIIGFHLEQSFHLGKELALDDGAPEVIGRRAALHLHAAARRAFARDEHSLSRELLNRALALLPERDVARGPLLADAASVLSAEGDWSGSRKLLRQATTIAQGSGDEGFQTYLEARLGLYSLSTDADRSIDDYIERVSAALSTLISRGATGYERRARFALAEAYTLRGQTLMAEATLQPVWRWREDLGDIDDPVVFDAMGAAVCAWTFGPLEVEKLAGRCEWLLREQLPLRARSVVLRGLAVSSAMRGEHADARACAEESRAILVDLGRVVLLARSGTWHGMIELLGGRLNQAEEALRSSLRAAVQFGDMYSAGLFHALLAQTFYELGQYEEATQHAEESDLSGMRAIEAEVIAGGVRAMVLAKQRQHKEARARAERAVAVADRTDQLDLRGEAHLALATVLAATDPKRDVQREARCAKELFERKGNVVSAKKAAERFDV